MDPSAVHLQPQAEAEDPLQAHDSHGDSPLDPRKLTTTCSPGHPAHHPPGQAGQQAEGAQGRQESGDSPAEARPGRAAPQHPRPGEAPEPSASPGKEPWPLAEDAAAAGGGGPSLLAEGAVAALAAEAGLPGQAQREELQVSVAATPHPSPCRPRRAPHGHRLLPHLRPRHGACRRGGRRACGGCRAPGRGAAAAGAQEPVLEASACAPDPATEVGHHLFLHLPAYQELLTGACWT